ncbi:MAG: transglutaminase-like domain-containing protein, partial [Planctomycetaceae bacterium]
SWQVLAEVPGGSYREGDWNWLKVRVEKDRLLCYINDDLAIESTDTIFRTGAVGMAKFRDTSAEFKQFAVARQLPSRRPNAETLSKIQTAIARVPAEKPPTADVVVSLVPESGSTSAILRLEARRLEQRAMRLRELSVAVQTRRVQEELQKILQEDTIDLLRAALLIARIDNEELDVDAYLKEVDEMVAEIQAGLGEDKDEHRRLVALNEYLFQKSGFHGSRTNYYHRSNSYLNEVIDDREGLPITLSVLYMEMARRLDLKVVGIGLPGHFVVRFEPEQGTPQLMDPFESGRAMTSQESDTLIRDYFRQPPTDQEFEVVRRSFLEPATERAVLIRILANLRGIATREQDYDAVLRYLSTVLVIDPENIESRTMRIELQIRTQRLEAAIADIEWLLEKKPEGLNIDAVQQIKADLEARLQAM